MHTPARPARPTAGIRRETENGFDVVFVPVADSEPAKLDGPTADLLQAAGLPLTGWYLYRARPGDVTNVCAPSQYPVRHPSLVVSRLIVGASPGQRVTYRNGNRLDLTRLNLRAESRLGRPAAL